jgi:outer membrane protein assembly factor BamA
MMRLSLLALALLALLPATLLAAPINEIIFKGNAVTRESVLRQELRLREGDEADSKLIEESRQAIMNLGLFKSVTSLVEEELQNGSMVCRLIFTVEERYFLLPIPLLEAKAKNDNVAEGLGSISYGFDLRHNNVMGLNHRLQLLYESEDFKDTGGDSSTESSLTYDIPRLIGTPYQLSLSAKQVLRDINEYQDEVLSGSYHQEVNSGSFYLSRWLNSQSISRGWRAGAGFGVTVVNYDEQSGSAFSYGSSQSVTLNTGISYDAVNEFPYHRDGEQYGYKLSLGIPQLGSDSSSHQHALFHRRYQPTQFADSNINTQIQLKLANGTGTTYALGNSALLRGYENDYAEGNAMLLINLEYHQHLSGYRQLRGVLFTDFGNAWPGISEIDLSEMPAGVGVGLRWRVQSFVDVTLRVDYAMALATGNNMITLNTSASF